jgi:ubiquinone/menaquinone biosynthesis C-methylase UbiE
MMIGERRDTPELMDEPSVDPGSLARALSELSVINRWLGGDRVSRLGVRRILPSIPHAGEVSVLDVGSGGSDLERALAPLDRPFAITALDLNPLAGEYARKNGRNVSVVVGSAHALPFADRSFDIAHASLFLHHCNTGEARRLLERLSRVARYGIVINDLHRHAFALGAITVLTRLFSRSHLVRNDAPVSVTRGFIRQELEDILPPLPADAVSLSRRWAFRWCLTIRLTNGTHDEPRR